MLTTIINNTKWFIKLNSNKYQTEVQIGFIFNLNETKNIKFDKEIILGIGKSKWNLNDKYDALYGLSLSIYRAVNQVSIALSSLDISLSNIITVKLIQLVATKLPNVIKKIDNELLDDIENFNIKEY